VIATGLVALIVVSCRFATGVSCASDLAWISGRAQNLVSHHLRALKDGGLAQSRREGRIVFYSLTEAGAELLKGPLGPTASVAP
jgi:DNA-binding transcriptional ArsR family regulator